MQEPQTRSATAATMSTARRACIWCYGTGRVPNDYHQRYEECDVCGGSGIRQTSPAIRPRGRPAVEIVAKAA